MTSRFVLPLADVGAGLTPSSGAQLFFYETGTTTPKDTYSDSAGTIPNDNPVAADSVGVFPDIFINGTYKVVLKNASNIQQWAADPVESFLRDSQLNDQYVLDRATLAAATADTTMKAGYAVNLAERTTGNGGGGMWDVIAGTGTANGIDIVAHDTLSLSFVLRTDGVARSLQFGMTPNASSATNDAALSQMLLYKHVVICEGDYTLTKTTSQTMIAGQSITGDGVGLTIIRGLLLVTTGADELSISGISFKECNKPLQFTNCNKILFTKNDIVGDVVEVSPRGIEVTDCDDVDVLFNSFEDVQYGAYWKQGTTVGLESKRGKVVGNTFIQNDASMSFPAGVYAVAVTGLVVANNQFNCPAATNQGYGFYQGDNTIQECRDIIISNNSFLASNDSDIRCDKAYNMTITGNQSRGTSFFVRFNGDLNDPVTGERSNNIIVSGNTTDGSEYLFNGQCKDILIEGNLIEGAAGLFGIRFLGDAISTPISDIQVINNKISNTGRSGILCQSVVGADIRNNRIINSNTDNETSNTSDRSKGIVCATADEVNVFDNYVENVEGAGFARYAVELGTSSLPNQRYGRNIFRRMVVSGYRSPYTVAPTDGDWQQGDRVPDVTPSASGTEGFICVESGTGGTLNGGATTGSISAGTSALTVNSIAGMEVGHYIAIIGVTGTKRITSISGLVVTIDSNADATVVGATVSFVAAVFKSYGVIGA